jgi:hypothetical protein
MVKIYHISLLGIPDWEKSLRNWERDVITDAGKNEAFIV